MKEISVEGPMAQCLKTRLCDEEIIWNYTIAHLDAGCETVGPDESVGVRETDRGAELQDRAN